MGKGQDSGAGAVRWEQGKGRKLEVFLATMTSLQEGWGPTTGSYH